MTDTLLTADGNKGEKPCCKAETQEKKLVKATDLPIHGNPYPPKDIIIDESPGLLESKIASVRSGLEPIVTPLSSAFKKTSEILSVGVAHTQSTMNQLAESQNTVLNVGMISGAGVAGFILARRGFFRRLIFSSIFFGGALVACYPTDAQAVGAKLAYIAKNKLPVVAQEQYSKYFTSNEPSSPQLEQTEPKTSV